MSAEAPPPTRQDERAGARSFRAWTLAVIALVIVAGTAVGATWILWSVFSDIPAEIAAPTLVGSATVIVSVASILITTRRQRQSEGDQEHRRRRIPVYEDLVHFIFTMLMADNLGVKQPTTEESVRAFAEFTEKVTLWGGPDLLHNWSELRAIGRDSTPVPGQVDISQFLAWEKFFLALREDVGHSNKGLKPGDLFRLFVNDLDDYMGRE